jgi:hypothetical protein
MTRAWGKWRFGIYVDQTQRGKGESSEMLEIDLDWNGPLIVGRRLSFSPTEVDALSRSSGVGVYLWYREYLNGDLVTYVGRGKIKERFERWLVQFLTLNCKSRNSDGTVFSPTTNPFAFFMNLDEYIEIGKSEVRLTRLHYALTTDFRNAESCLIAGLKARERSSSGHKRRVIFGNKRLEKFDPNTRLRHSYSRLDEPEAQRGTLAYILGEPDE